MKQDGETPFSLLENDRVVLTRALIHPGERCPHCT